MVYNTFTKIQLIQKKAESHRPEIPQPMKDAVMSEVRSLEIPAIPQPMEFPVQRKLSRDIAQPIRVGTTESVEGDKRVSRRLQMDMSDSEDNGSDRYTSSIDTFGSND